MITDLWAALFISIMIIINPISGFNRLVCIRWCVSVRDLSIFSIVSKEINGQIRAYISTLAWRKKMINENFNHSISYKQSFVFGYYKDLSKSC